MNTTGKILTAFAVGAVAGAVFGILFAPQKGSDTRRKIGETGKKFANSFGDIVGKGIEKLNVLKEDSKKIMRENVGEFEEA